MCVIRGEKKFPSFWQYFCEFYYQHEFQFCVAKRDLKSDFKINPVIDFTSNWNQLVEFSDDDEM